MARIWIINQYASTPQTGMGGRHHYFARELVRRGHEVTVVAASWHHLLRDDIDSETLPTTELVDGYRFFRVRVPRYSEAHAHQRVLNWLLFALRVAGIHRRLQGRPDAILYSSPSLIGYLGAERLAQRLGVRLIFEVRDIWPLTLVEIGGYSSRHPFIRFLRWVEDRAYVRADAFVSNLEGAIEHMTSRGMDRNRFTWVPNGISTEASEAPEPLTAAVAEKIPGTGLRIAYTGTLGLANSLDTLIEAAVLIRDLSDVHFILAGRGRERARLEQQVVRHGLCNVIFTGPVPKRQVQSLLAAVDACYIGWRVSSLYQWGIAANKLAEYFWAGKPVLHSFSGRYDPNEKSGGGITVPAEDPQALAAAIRKLHDMPEAERRRMGENGRRAALEHYDYAKLAIKLEQVLVPDEPQGTCGVIMVGEATRCPATGQAT